MKRFVTYLYEYENGVKTKSAGFIRVDIRGAFVNMEICIRKFLRGGETGIVYGLVPSHGLKGIFWGNIKVLGGQGDLRLQLSADHLQDTEFSIDDVAGVGIRFSNESYIASCWKDAYAQEIGHGEFKEYQDICLTTVEETALTDTEIIGESKVHENIKLKSAEIKMDAVVQGDTIPKKEIRILDEITSDGNEPAAYQETGEIAIVKNEMVSENTKIQNLPEKQYIYKKIDLTHMREIPLQDRHYSSNAFLIHGFWNYGYLIFKTEVEGTHKKVSLGVPGIYERQEAAMAMAFGFPEFETIPEKMIGEMLLAERTFSPEEIKQNQLSKERTFGCWFTKL